MGDVVSFLPSRRVEIPSGDEINGAICEIRKRLGFRTDAEAIRYAIGCAAMVIETVGEDLVLTQFNDEDRPVKILKLA